MSIITTDNKRKLTVVMILQSLPPEPCGGAEIQALRLAEKLKEKNVDVLILAPGTLALKGSSVISNVSVHRLHSFLSYITDFLFFIKKKSTPPKTVIEYDDNTEVTDAITRKIGIGARLRYQIFIQNALWFLERYKPVDILHSHTIEWPGYAAAVLSKKTGKRLIVKDSTMNGIFNILRFPNGKKKQRVIIEQAQFVAMTNAIRLNLIDAGVTSERITMIPNGININANPKSDYSGTKKVLFVGNLYQQPAKGIDLLLKAWRTVSQRLPEATLEIAGDGDIQAFTDFCNKINIGNTVKFLGKCSDIPSLMYGADVFVLPSRREGMPNVLMEAMLRGLPCVATDISGSQDLIDNHVTGMLVKTLDINALAEAIIYMLENRHEAELMGKAARKKIIEKFDMNNVADQYLKLYQQ